MSFLLRQSFPCFVWSCLLFVHPLDTFNSPCGCCAYLYAQLLPSFWFFILCLSGFFSLFSVALTSLNDHYHLCSSVFTLSYISPLARLILHFSPPARVSVKILCVFLFYSLLLLYSVCLSAVVFMTILILNLVIRVLWLHLPASCWYNLER